ncbi:hypothetical protein O7615_07395 [Micromonospora sp. WMMD1082]|nr:hypothetical protein [Micromonospora sp. WMMD1082]MDG4793701.1 hypothetical protein [Micromonospora sp. WMMD1082]
MNHTDSDPRGCAYASLYERLRSAALSPADSLDFLASVAEELPDYTRR